MTELPKERTSFLGTYFDRDAVLRLVLVANIFSWVVLVIYAGQLVLSAAVFILSALRGYTTGMGFSDYAQQILFLVEQPFRGVVYFVVLQAVGKALLIFMDVEDNTRRAARR